MSLTIVAGEHKLAGGQPDADDDESAISANQDEATIPAHLCSSAKKEPNDATSFYLACKKVCDDPKQRSKHFPVAHAVRRVRAWAGAELPEDVQKRVKGQLPGSPALKRRAASSKAALVSLRKRVVRFEADNG